MSHTFHMESESRRALDDIASIRSRTVGVSRAHAVVQLAYTFLLAAYMGVLVYTGSVEGGASVFGGVAMALMLPPVIVSSILVSGATERFGGRLRTTARQWAAIGFFLFVLVGLLIWGIVGEGYPWWMALVIAAITVVLFSIRPLGVLRRAKHASAGQETWRTVALPLPARVTTVVVGVHFGLACALVLVPVAAWLVTMAGLMYILVATVAQTSAWGLLHTGYAWRLPQWVGFAVATTVMFVLVVLIIATDIVTPPVAITAGAAVAASLILSAFLPRRAHGAPSA